MALASSAEALACSCERETPPAPSRKMTLIFMPAAFAFGGVDVRLCGRAFGSLEGLVIP